jgi:hypothetical protein
MSKQIRTGLMCLLVPYTKVRTVTVPGTPLTTPFQPLRQATGIINHL